MAMQALPDEAYRQVSWLVRVLVDRASSVVGHAVGASSQGLWVRFAWLPPGTMKLGERYRVELHPGTGHRSTHTAEVRYLAADVVGLKTDRPLALGERPATGPSPDHARGSAAESGVVIPG